MRITKLEITNFQGLRHAALDVSAPVLLVAGHNGAGKSSLLDAIAMAFNGQPRRVSLKKEMDKLVTEGAKKGEARVEWLDAAYEVQVCGVALPTGKGSPLTDSPFLPYVLDASLFASLDAKERRRVLFDLSGASTSPNQIAERLIAKGHAAALVEKVKPLLRSGFPAAVEQAKSYASEARGAWKAITGENYGSEKAVDWAPELLATVVTEDQVAEAGKNLQLLEDDLAEAQQALAAAEQIKVLEAESVEAPSAEAIANGEQAINELRQARDASRAKLVALQEALEAATQREASIAKAQAAHQDVVAWTGMVDALSPTGIPAEILADAIGPVNDTLKRLAGIAGWSPVEISADIDVTFGGRLYGLLSESERWRCDTTIALAIATISGLRLVLLDRLDVLDLPSRNQAIALMRAMTSDREIDSVVVAGTLKEPMAKTPEWLQAVWINAGQLADQHQQAAA